MSAEQPGQTMPQPRAFFDREKRGQRLRRVSGILENRMGQRASLGLFELRVGKGKAIDGAFVLQELVDQARKRPQPWPIRTRDAGARRFHSAPYTAATLIRLVGDNVVKGNPFDFINPLG